MAVRLVIGAAATILVSHLLAAHDPGEGSTLSAFIRPPKVAQPDSLAWEVWSAGAVAGANNVVWRSAAGQHASGNVTIRVEYAGSPDRQGLPVWPVNVWLFVAAADERSSFAAELSGSIDWRTGHMRATGLVTDGLRAGAPVEQTLRQHGPQLPATLTLRVGRSQSSRAG